MKCGLPRFHLLGHMVVPKNKNKKKTKKKGTTNKGMSKGKAPPYCCCTRIVRQLLPLV
jgi:hypothetical protein